MAKIVFGRVENILGKEEMLVSRIFPLYPMFSKDLSPHGRQKSRLCGKWFESNSVFALIDNAKIRFTQLSLAYSIQCSVSVAHYV